MATATTQKPALSPESSIKAPPHRAVEGLESDSPRPSQTSADKKKKGGIKKVLKKLFGACTTAPPVRTFERTNADGMCIVASSEAAKRALAAKAAADAEEATCRAIAAQMAADAVAAVIIRSLVGEIVARAVAADASNVVVSSIVAEIMARVVAANKA